jgi:hypothetical protein
VLKALDTDDNKSGDTNADGIIGGSVLDKYFEPSKAAAKGGGKKIVKKEAPTGEVTPPAPVAPTAPEVAATPKETTVAAKPTLWDIIVKNKVLIAGVLMAGAVYTWFQGKKKDAMAQQDYYNAMPPNPGFAYNNALPNQSMFSRNPFS